MSIHPDLLATLRGPLSGYIDAQGARDYGRGTHSDFRQAHERLEMALARVGVQSLAELALRLIEERLA